MKIKSVSQYRQGWTFNEDVKLAEVAINVIRKGGSKTEACKAAARQLDRTVEGTKTRWRALNESASYYRRYSITDNGVRVQGLTVKHDTAREFVTGKSIATLNRLPFGFNDSSSEVTVTVGGCSISGSPSDLRKILGI